MIPVGWKLPIDKLAPGPYSVIVNAIDSNGGALLARTAEFEIE